ncbi:hypothetical protein [Acaryochloris thomasi]|uniref:hypothetical protein n=1 Tax=Acaryochloris thomasi TaxID=2929456 RepID=UPI001F1E09C8|nr:hypothetical protein [Acaryochloris thomasi]
MGGEDVISPAQYHAATQRLKQLHPIGQTIALREITGDRYGRTVAEAGESVGLQLVSEGYAVGISQIS